jgi:hypothetical protein
VKNPHLDDGLNLKKSFEFLPKYFWGQRTDQRSSIQTQSAHFFPHSIEFPKRKGEVSIMDESAKYVIKIR